MKNTSSRWLGRSTLCLFTLMGFALVSVGCTKKDESAGTGGTPPAADAPAAATASTGAEQSFPSGLKMTHTQEGSGANPSPTQVVKVHYEGTLMDGTVFDSSYKRGMPAEFPLNRVIPCWTEGVGKMKVGGTAELICPPAIAYGETGAPPVIPPNATLKFKVELLGIQ